LRRRRASFAAVAVLAAAGCVDIERAREERALSNLLGRWRSVAYYSAEPIGFEATIEFRADGQAIEYARWKEPEGRERVLAAARAYSVAPEPGSPGVLVLAIDGWPPSKAVFDPRGRLVVVRPTMLDALDGRLEAKIVFEREE